MLGGRSHISSLRSSSDFLHCLAHLDAIAIIDSCSISFYLIISMSPKKRIHLNFFETTCTGSHMSVGMWKDPKDNSRTKDRLDYYIWLAKLAEKGKITSIFFADTVGSHH